MSMHGLGDQRARDDLVGPARRDAGQLGELVGAASRPAWGSTRCRSASGERRGDERAVARRGRAADAGQRAERLRGRGRVVGRAGRAAGGRRRGRCRRGSACAAARIASSSGGAVGRSARGPAGPAPSGSDQATSGASSAPPAISSEPPPMSKTASRPADQPNQRRTARKVSRASSSPGSTSIRTPVSSCDVVEHRRRSCRRRAPRRWRSRACPRSPCPRRPRRRLATNAVSASMPVLDDRAVVVEVLGEPQRLLVGVRRQRRGAAVGVDHEQVPGVGADVEDAQAHAPRTTDCDPARG